jgi:hypothetical protein
MLVVDIADSLYEDLGQPSSTSIASIAFWLRNHIGHLNTLIGTSYVLDEDQEIMSGDNEIGTSEADILKQLYMVYWAKLQVKNYLGASGTESVLTIEDDGAKVTKINKTTLASEYRNLAKDEQLALDQMVNSYKRHGSLPVQVTGDDTVAAVYQVVDPRTRYV